MLCQQRSPLTILFIKTCCKLAYVYKFNERTIFLIHSTHLCSNKSTSFFLFGELVVSRKDTIPIIKTMDRNV